MEKKNKDTSSAVLFLRFVLPFVAVSDEGRKVFKNSVDVEHKSQFLLLCIGRLALLEISFLPFETKNKISFAHR